MAEELDVNKITAELVSQNISTFLDTGKGALKGAADKIRLHLNSTYRDYLLCLLNRYSKGKSFFIRNEPTYLYDFYVPIGVVCGKTIVSKASISDICSINPYSIITGSAGSGKSMLMRHLLLDTIKSKQKVPVFLELRELNQTKLSLKEFIQDTLTSNEFGLDSDFTERAMKAGHFVFLLDGFDEVQRTKKRKVRIQIHKLIKSYDKNFFVLSSRPDQEFAGWPFFSLFEISPLTLMQACELIEKLRFDSDLKPKFLEELRGGAFEKHRSFLSNPLLLSIMFLTYGESADIPRKLNVFYSKAYDALFQRHDALKAGFKRDRCCQLDINDFAKVFSALSVLTYDKRIFQMSRPDAIGFLEKSRRITNLQYDSNDYLDDSLKAVCLLIEDGLSINYAHRSFQEYFVARFIDQAKPEVQQRLIEKYTKYIGEDNVISLLYEENADLVERMFIVPNIDYLGRLLKINRGVGVTHYLRYLKMQYNMVHFDLDSEHKLSASMTDDYNPLISTLINFILREVRPLILKPKYPNELDAYSFMQKYLDPEGRVRIRVSQLKPSDPFTKDLMESKTFLSKRVLDHVFATKSEIVEKHRRRNKSIEELLSL